MKINVVPSTVDFVFDLVILGSYHMILDNNNNVPRCFSANSIIHLVRKHGHIYSNWNLERKASRQAENFKTWAGKFSQEFK